MRREKVLFICTGNSARSQMGEALLRKLAGYRFDVFSAGTEPKPIHPLTLRVLDEKGIATDRLVSKGLDELLTEGKFDHVIVVCGHANRTCPATLPGMKERLFWPFEDPAAFEGTEEEKLARFKKVRDQIEKKIREWLEPAGEHAPESPAPESPKKEKAAPDAREPRITDVEPPGGDR